MMHDSESNENKDAWFSARVWDLVITGGIQGENRPENQDTFTHLRTAQHRFAIFIIHHRNQRSLRIFLV
jgi:hypothetical protein